MDAYTYLKDMLYCGSNKKYSELDFTDKISGFLKGDSNQMLDRVNVIFSSGVKRTALPFMYSPRLDFSDGEGFCHACFTFLDTGRPEIVRFRMYQLNDDNTFFRAMGNKIPYTLDLTDAGAIFDRIEMPRYKDYLPAAVKMSLDEHDPLLFKNYIEPFIYNYERMLVKVRTIYRNVIIPLERENLMWKNLANRTTQFYNIGGLAQYNKVMDAITGSNQPMRQRPMTGLLPEEL